MKTLKTLIALGAILFTTVFAGVVSAKEPTTVVLVHGAFADGSSWSKVIPRLEKAGLNVIAVQNPLESLAGDVAFTHRAINSAPGDVVLVGHSWGGMVITEAGVHPKVKSLVYVAAYAPDAGQSLLDVAGRYPDAPGLGFLSADAEGYLRLSKEGVTKHFAHDVSAREQDVIAVTQGALNSKALEQKVSNVAWKHKPNFAVVATQDTMTLTQLQRDQVKKLDATAVEAKASHVVMVSQPKAVANLIIKAAR